MIRMSQTNLYGRKLKHEEVEGKDKILVQLKNKYRVKLN